MAIERLTLAIADMERALTRLETAQGRLVAVRTSSTPADPATIAARHARLKSAAAEALAGIDAILANHR